MVTRNRVHLARRALACLKDQHWDNKELIIVDDGDADYTALVNHYGACFPIHYHRLRDNQGQTLGALRNLCLELAQGDYCIQWDDDEWYHPQRISIQMQALLQHQADATVLRSTLMHLDDASMVNRPYRTQLKRGTPGTILHRRTHLRYPAMRRHEDTRFLRAIANEGKVHCIDDHAHLFIRCFHGSNTWHRKHFYERLHRGLKNRWHYLNARYRHRDLFSHPSFQLSAQEEQAAEQFLIMSRELNLLSS